MKTLLIIGAMSIGYTSAWGQTTPGMSHNKWEENSHTRYHKNAPVHTNPFVDAEISINEGIVSFSGLPDVTKPVYAIITNAEGEYIRQAKISPNLNTINISRLHHGLYFITIVYKNESRKAFTLNL